MEHNLRDDEKAMLKEQFKRRLDRLNRVVELNGPEPVVGMMLYQVWRTGLYLFGQHLWDQVQQWHLKQARIGNDRCVECGKHSQVEYCNDCLAEVMTDLIGEGDGDTDADPAVTGENPDER